MAVCGDHEITWNQFGALMDQLKKGVLSVRPRLAPNDRARTVIRPFAGQSDAFAVAFHVELLQMIGEKAHRVVVGNDGMCLRFEKVIIPNAQKAHNDRNVFFKRRLAEMQIDLISAL